MTTVAGYLQRVAAGTPPGMSSSLGLHTPWSGASRGWTAHSSAGTPVPAGLLSFASTLAAGHVGGGPGSDLFDRILVLPRSRALGFVLPQTTWYPEVWNTFRRATKTLTGIDISGVGGLQILGPAAMPFFPGQSQIYSAVVPLDGPATISQTATWQFAGVTGADMTVTGSRISVFPHRPDWSEPFRERLAWKTRILVSYKRTEQRIRLRHRPRYTLIFRVVSTTPQETASMESLLFGWHGKVFGVPAWPEKSQLLAAIPSGERTLTVDTRYRPALQVGGFVMIWSGFRDWEAFQVESFTDDALVLASPVGRSWDPGAWVVPLRRGRLMDDLSLDRPTNWVTAGPFTFSCEAV